VYLRRYLEFYAYDIVVGDYKTTVNEGICDFEEEVPNPWFDTAAGMRDHLQEFRIPANGNRSKDALPNYLCSLEL